MVKGNRKKVPPQVTIYRVTWPLVEELFVAASPTQRAILNWNDCLYNLMWVDIHNLKKNLRIKHSGEEGCENSSDYPLPFPTLAVG